MSRYMADGRRKSSMTHATRGHPCSLCDNIAYGNGGAVSHGRAHVRRGEAVELLKLYPYTNDSSRLFLAPGDLLIEKFLGEGYGEVKL